MSFGHDWNGTSASSLYDTWANTQDHLQYIIDLPLVFMPGTRFNYSDGASHLLSVIISEAADLNTLDFAKENLFDPLDIKNFEWAKDDKGLYNGKQVVPESWIDTMTTTKISTDNDVLYVPEYGYQIWIGNSSDHQYFMAMGWGGQFIFIVPDQNLVVTATCWTSDLTWEQAGQHWTSIIKLIIEKIFPAVQ